jgi:mannose/fructose/N-acetylgalactosamine-specific phosphotransferase system component IIC
MPPENINENININILGINILGIIICLTAIITFAKNEKKSTNKHNENKIMSKYCEHPNFSAKTTLLLLWL